MADLAFRPMENCKIQALSTLLATQPTEVTQKREIEQKRTEATQKREIEQERQSIINTTIMKTEFSQGVNGTEAVDVKCISITEPARLSGATKLRRMIEETGELIVCPGVYDGLSARIAQSIGFSALYMTGAGTAASRLGQPDLGIAHLHDMKTNAEMIANLDPYGPPLIADMDTGYGGPIIVANSVKSYIRAGVAGFHIEDQVMSKRCGHLKGKEVVHAEEYYTRLRAAKAAKDAMGSDIVFIARTDALQSRGYDECIRRLKMARSIGADVGLLEGPTSKVMAAQAVKDLAPWPLMLNIVENGVSPIITTTEAKEMGFRLIIFSFACIAPAYLAIHGALEKLKTEGVVGTAKGVSPLEIFEVCGLRDSVIIDAQAGGESFAKGF